MTPTPTTPGRRVPLTPHAEYVREKAREWVAREAAVATGVGCPDCGRELHRVRPPVRTTSERVYALTACSRCGRQAWIPE